ncbi:kynurenine/alpha-aminoadipate aminotransferase [Coprinopsis cinerea okayama7|uniref:Kynurenine/alpha-aminoadipate aminotransferase n=1 Tax=Coprinopsis cinerea (strain Okayama-7 / 130 / ATCC MYA-4618 / FGSC 9003) TaxID=240176 RepID=D6RP20_COPC7|nr:kynurenine/alpha-aminoadipate aminotransferase [Coprinopsis cinerea okayama7\|eukprot:XP_002910665.1 kynurenine/alpha-aminoadipate aminotransferase [Coprinopsis cinerea okayama7\
MARSKSKAYTPAAAGRHLPVSSGNQSIAGSSRHETTTSSLTEIRFLPPEYYSSRLSTVAQHRKPSPIWDLFSVEGKPGMLSMLAGKPHPSTFPFEHITLGFRTPNTQKITNMTLQEDELETALQYGMTAGIPELVGWVEGMMRTVHSRGENEGWRVSMGAGSQDLLYKAFNALLNPGDTILVEGPTYPTIMPILDAMSCQYAIVDSDEDGISTVDLEKVLSTWDEDVKGPLPRVLYTVPFGSNPGGVTASLQRRIGVLQLARRYDLLILEDDPYYFLYYGDAPRPPSYFTLDRQLGGEVGRVLRFDSFSKILSSGFRLGWLTGPDRLLVAIERHPNSLSQVIILKLLKEWGLEGFLAHTSRTADFYRQRRDTLNAYLERHLAELAEWKPPDASMFFWIKLRLPYQNREADSTAFIRDKAISKGVLVLPGATAFPDGRKTTRVRLSFSLLSDQEMEEAIKRLAEVLREEQPHSVLPSPTISRMSVEPEQLPTPPSEIDQHALGPGSNSSAGKKRKGRKVWLDYVMYPVYAHRR